MRMFGIELPPVLDGPVSACREHLRLAAVLSALVNILYLAPTIYMMQVYDRVVATGGIITLIWLTLVAAFALATLALLDSMRSRILIRAGLRLDRELAEKVIDRTFAQPAGPNDALLSAQALRHFDSLRQAMSGPAAASVFDLPWTPIYVLIAFLLHPVLGIAVLLSALLLLGVTILNERATSAGTKQAMQMMSASYAAQERLGAIAEVIRALGMRSVLVDAQVRARHLGLEETRVHQFKSCEYAALTKFLRLFLQSVALGIGAWLAVDHQISAGSIIAASVLMSRTLQPVEQVVGSWKMIIEARQSIELLGKLFESGAAKAEDDRFALPVPQGAVTCSGLTVVPAGAQVPILFNVSFALDKGDFLGIVGASGAGKSTLLRAVAGAIRLDRGDVRFDGFHMRDWDHDVLARHIGYLPQDCALVPGTIAENISRFTKTDDSNRDAVTAAILEASQIADVHSIIGALPGGYDMRIGWNGEGLSAGQRQRIALARALYGNPSILILDEPNAALDSQGEAALIGAIAKFRERGATIFVAAHREAILAGANKLLVMAAGQVRLFGPSGDVIRELGKQAAMQAATTETAMPNDKSATDKPRLVEAEAG
ncbi:type I secretion system permease/ATPase [Novosphingobium sp. MMS21-SN21R]|uniref:type I secretion system permease/ATPase n=1 Tax=Novosphingobium sp. MMS21-SN21R TaxID=2969298 RepID=UPI0028849457|nr:type I secretion system permease/ATPase [Novosphingobium sp. MMS21-SN21R]MDT0508380.1 type I secretion system permease/ATPase [Novosphingobium sp. MMS21-SN21R]